MADNKKTTKLDELSTLASTDLIIGIDDVSGTPTTTKVELDTLDDYLSASEKTLTNKTLTSPKINEDVAVTSTATEINVLDGIPTTLTKTELGYVDGVTSAIQTQMNLKAPLASPTFTGTVVLPNSQILTTPVLNTSFSGTAKATGAEINTGTEDGKIVTPKAIEDSYIGLYFYNPNVIINPGFTINQRVWASDAVLADGIYGHDRWKGGASGGDYTFTQLNGPTTITIKADKSLIQVVDVKNVVGGTYTLSWTGTAQARLGIDSATPSGDYADSPVTATGQTAGTVMSVEFDDGTLGKVQLNSGSVALPFMPKSFEDELGACKRYFEKSYPYATAIGTDFDMGVVAVDTVIGRGLWHSTNVAASTDRKRAVSSFEVEKRTTPGMVYYDLAGTASRMTSLDTNGGYVADAITEQYQAVVADAVHCAGHTAANLSGFCCHWTASAEL